MPFKDPEKRAAYDRARNWRAASVGYTVAHNEGCPHLTTEVLAECSCDELVVGGIGVLDRNAVAQDERKGRAGYAARTNRFVFVDSEGLTFHRLGCRGEQDESCRCPHQTLLVAANGGEVGKEQTFRIENEEGLSPRAIWDFLLSLPERFGPAIYGGYGFNYDTEMLLPPRGEPDPRTGWDRLDRLDKTGACRYGPYQFVVWERKRFALKRLEGEPRSRVCVDDLLSSFGGRSFETVVDKFLPKEFFTPEERALLAEGKAARGVWTLEHFRSGFVRRYNELELRAGLAIARGFNDCRRSPQVGVVSSDFYSPAVIAKSWFRSWGIKKALATPLPDEVPEGASKSVRGAAYAAYFGGRIECGAYGTHRGPITEYDRNAAYPYAETTLPNFSRGRWTWENGPFCWRDNHPTSLYKVHISVPDAALPRFLPLPWRESDRGGVFYPNDVTTWVWAPELEWTLENAPAWVELWEAWHFDEDDPTDRPLAPLAQKYEERLRLEDESKHDLANAVKIGSNATYGATAQRVSARKTGQPPTYHNIACAGLTTAITRAAVFRAAFEAWDSERKAPATIAIATDAILVTGTDPPPPSIRLGRALGEWKAEAFSWGRFIGSGLYQLGFRDPKQAPVERARGVRQRRLPWDKVAEAWRAGKETVTFYVTSFIGHKRAKGSPRKFSWRSWQQVPREVKVRNAGNKRQALPVERGSAVPDPSREVTWTLPRALPVLNEETAANLPDFEAVVPPHPRPEDFETCEADEDEALEE